MTLSTGPPSVVPPPGLTVHVESIYPANRIVVDYRDLDDLVPLAAVDLGTGLLARLASTVEDDSESIVEDPPEGFLGKDFALRAATQPDRGRDLLGPGVKPGVAPSTRAGSDDGD